MSGISSITLWEDGDPLSPTVLNSKLQPLISNLSNLSLAGLTPVVVQSNGSTIGSVQTLNFVGTPVVGSVITTLSIPLGGGVQMQYLGSSVTSSTATLDVDSNMTISVVTGVPKLTALFSLQSSGVDMGDYRYLNIGPSLSITTSNLTATIDIRDAAPVSLVTGYRIYLEADNGMPYNDGDSVSTWFDASGNGLDFSTFSNGTDRPTYKTDPDGDNFPVVRFNGTGTGLKRTSNISYTGADLTIALLVRSAARSQTNSVIASGMDAGQTNIGSDNWYTAVDGTFHGMVAAGHQGGASQQYGAQAQPIAGSAYRMALGWRAFIFRWSTVTTNTARYTLSVYDNASQAAFSQTSHPFGYTQIGIGGNIGSVATGWDALSFQEFDLRCFALWESALRDDQIRQVQRYFGVKYKIPGLV